MSDTHTQVPHNEPLSPSPGEQLRGERERLGISLEETADALHLRPAVIKGLEQDSYEEIPVATYRRGYLRAYAKYLGMDETPVLEAYKERHGSLEAGRTITPVSVSRPPSRFGTLIFRLVTLLIIAGLIAVTVMWWQSRGGSTPPGLDEQAQTGNMPDTASPEMSMPSTALSSTATSESETAPSETAPPEAPALASREASRDDPSSITPSQARQAAPALTETPDDATLPDATPAIDSMPDADTPEPMADLTRPETPDTDTDTDTETEIDTDNTDNTDNTAPETVDQGNSDRRSEAPDATEGTSDENETVAGTATETREATSDATRTIDLTFNEQSWTEIFDANNQRVFVGLQEPGTTASVEGEPPFRLTVGNATGVELRYQGSVIDLEARAAANNVARFTLGE